MRYVMFTTGLLSVVACCVQGFGRFQRNRRLIKTDLRTGAYVYQESRVAYFHYTAVDARCGHHAVVWLKVFHVFLVLLNLALLGTDHEEIKNHDDQTHEDKSLHTAALGL